MDCDKIINGMKNNILTFGHQLKKNGLLYKFLQILKGNIFYPHMVLRIKA
jgi:hypothetical protein